MRRWPIVLAVVVAVPVLGVAAASWWLNGDGLKARLAEQVERATGRQLTISGPISLAWSFSPTVVLTDVSLSNPPGFARPRMAHVDRVEARIGLGALLERRVVIERVAVVAPTIELERDAAGHPNWVFTPPAPAAGQTAPSTPHAERFALSVGTVDITDAAIGWNQQTINAPHLAYDSATAAVSGTLMAGDTALVLSGRAEPLDLHLAQAGAGPGIAAGLTGTSTAATLTVSAADLAALSPVVGRPLPSIRDVALQTTLPGPSAIQIRIGSATVGPLAVGDATLTTASLTDPVALTARATLGHLPLAVTGQIGSIADILRGPVQIDARATGENLTLTAAGTLASTGTGTFQLGATSSDLGIAGLPMLRSVQATAALHLDPGTAALTGLQLSSAQGDLAGDLTVRYGSHPSLKGTLASRQFDFEILARPAAPAPAAAPPTIAVPAPQPTRLLPDQPIPFDMLRQADADLDVTVAALRLAGATYTNVSVHAALADGTLRLDPVSLSLGAATARATIQMDASPPAMHATIDAPNLPIAAIVALLGETADGTGTLDVHANLAGTGGSIRALAATLSGRAGLALVDAQIDNALLERLAPGSLRKAGVSFDGAGTTNIRCAAVAADAASGQVRLSALTLDTSRLALDGGGEIDLGTEGIDLHLRPELRIGGGLSVPIRLRGTLAAPKVQLDPGALASGRVGIVLGGPPPPDRCGPALAAAREWQAGAPAAAPSPPRKLKPADILRGLLR